MSGSVASLKLLPQNFSPISPPFATLSRRFDKDGDGASPFGPSSQPSLVVH